MEALWRASPLAVRAVCARLTGKPALAYTTVMTTLDRLYKKGLLKRHKDGNAFIYEPALSQDEYRRRIVAHTMTGLLERPADAEPVLAAFVDAAADVSEDNLKRLEELIVERRRSGR